ncbi:hypothetical protein EXN66_Car016514 [Channa argus]|uniref:Uncharacterized protein n=1 Tax=Channa argus TaxID=215402 RepID=A0A6G1QFD1_CHAAH|nr:hypothetical protein EXN66_Car016514 [Channa argus]
MLTDCRKVNKQKIDIGVYYYAHQPYGDSPFLFMMRVILCVEQSDAKICFAQTGHCFSSVGNCELRTLGCHLILEIWK